MSQKRPPLWAIMERFEVPSFDDPDATYLTRWRIIETPWLSLYLHRLGTPDSRPTLHDHPWPFLSLILRGGYDECRRYGAAPVSVRFFNAKRSTDVHWISRLHRTPTWTLMLVGRRNRTWGYVDPDGAWTEFDQHPHALEFDAAIRARKVAR